MCLLINANKSSGNLGVNFLSFKTSLILLFSKAFTEGMGYVALSRVRALSGIKLMGLNEMALRVNSIITELDEKLIEMSNEAKNELESLGDLKKNDALKAFLAR